MPFEYETTLEKFKAVMAEKLEENQHKNGWQHDDYKYLLKRLYEEVTELWDALEKDEMSETFGGKEVVREAADVACFAMMLADISGGLALAEYNKAQGKQ